MLAEEREVSAFVEKMAQKKQYVPSSALDQLKDVKNPDGVTSAGVLKQQSEVLTQEMIDQSKKRFI